MKLKNFMVLAEQWLALERPWLRGGRRRLVFSTYLER